MMDRIGWKIYFGVLFLLNVVGVIVNALTEDYSYGFKDFADCIISMCGLVGVFGYAFQRQLYYRKFWRTLPPIVIIWDIWLVACYFNAIHSGFPQEEILFASIFFLVFASILIVPKYIALYLYAYRSRDIWEGTYNGGIKM